MDTSIKDTSCFPQQMKVSRVNGVNKTRFSEMKERHKVIYWKKWQIKKLRNLHFEVAQRLCVASIMKVTSGFASLQSMWQY